MPRPAYIVCSLLGSIDQYTNAPSCFNIVESINIEDTLGTAAGRAAPDPDEDPLVLRVLATWLREPDEPDDRKYECELLVLLKDSKGTQPLAAVQFDPFLFTAPFYRCTVPQLPLPHMPGPGLMTIETRIRPIGTEEWVARQSFPILVIEAKK
jgi:hypothetical protein